MNKKSGWLKGFIIIALIRIAIYFPQYWNRQAELEKSSYLSNPVTLISLTTTPNPDTSKLLQPGTAQIPLQAQVPETRTYSSDILTFVYPGIWKVTANEPGQVVVGVDATRVQIMWSDT